MITKNTSNAIMGTLAANVASAYLDYQNKRINRLAFDRIKNDALTLASMHLNSYKELKGNLKDMGIE